MRRLYYANMSSELLFHNLSYWILLFLLYVVTKLQKVPCCKVCRDVDVELLTSSKGHLLFDLSTFSTILILLLTSFYF